MAYILRSLLSLPSPLSRNHFFGFEWNRVFFNIKKKDYGEEFYSYRSLWLTSILLYLFYLTNQKSVLNTWPKPNELSDLLAGYNDSLLILTILIPIFTIILTKKSNDNTKPSLIRETHF